MLGRWTILLRNSLQSDLAHQSVSHSTSLPTLRRYASSSSSTRWQSRQSNDKFSKEARVQGLKSRAAFKLLELNEKYKLFKPGQTVVDLGYAPGSWSQVAHDRTAPNGRVIGIDILPVQPPKGVSTIQGNFLSPLVQQQVRDYVRDPNRWRIHLDAEKTTIATENESVSEHNTPDISTVSEKSTLENGDERQMEDRVVDVVLSDMSAPWDQTTGFWKKSLSDPYRRMMNTSGVSFRDHIGSMELCEAALDFAFETLTPGGSFVCKFYQGAEDKILQKKLKTLFTKVHREKPESSRTESRENFFVALKRKDGVAKTAVFPDPRS